MSRLLEFHQADEAVIVARILLQVHKAIDHNFPHVKQPSRKFAKTLFSENDEPTHNKTLPTSVDGLPVIPPPPPPPGGERASFRDDTQPLSPLPVPLEGAQRLPPPPSANKVPPPPPAAETLDPANEGSAFGAVSRYSTTTRLSAAQGIERYQHRRRTRTLLLLILLLAAWAYFLYDQKVFLHNLFTAYSGKTPR